MPKKWEQWKQPTPIMQLRAILASFDGHKDNHKSGITTDQQYMATTDLHLAQLMDLLPYVEKGKWDA